MAFLRGLNRSAGSKKATSRAQSRAGRARARRHAGENGQAVVEMALMLPILASLMLTIFYVGWGFNNKILVTQAVGAGGAYIQALAQNTATQIADPCAATTAVIQSAAPSLNPTNLTLTYTLNGTSYGATCSGGSSNFVLGATLTVKGTYPCTLVIMGVNYAPGCLITAQTSELIY